MARISNFSSISRKIFSLFIVITLLLPIFSPWKNIQVFASPRAEEYSLIALLVDEDIYNQGLESDTESLSGKIFRYAKDIQSSQERTKTIIIPVPKNRNSGEIFSILERLYIEGERKQNSTFFLKGTVLIGGVKIPHIESPVGNIPSIFPYTDFENPSFLWETDQEKWIENPVYNSAEAEIWHGIIPGTTEELLAFFDKNHKAKTSLLEGKIPTEEKVLFLDFSEEEKNMDPYFSSQYKKRSELLGEFKNLRYNSTMLGYLMDTFMSSDAFTLPKNIDSKWFPNGSFWDSKYLSTLKEKNLYSDFPDTRVKDTIENLLPEYSQLTKNFEEELRAAVQKTGRWDGNQVESIPSLITIIDRYVAEKIQKINNQSIESTRGIGKKLDSGVLLVTQSKIPIRVQESGSDGGTSTIIVPVLNYNNGILVSSINRPEECTLYRGEFEYTDPYPQMELENWRNLSRENNTVESQSALFVADPLKNVPSQQVEFNTLYDIQALTSYGTDIVNQCEKRGGCCSMNMYEPGKCNPDNAISPIFSWNGDNKVSSISEQRSLPGTPSPVNSALSCKKFNFHLTQRVYRAISAPDVTTPIYSSTANISPYIKRIPSLMLHEHSSTRDEKTLQKVLSNPLSKSLPTNRTPYFDLQSGNFSTDSNGKSTRKYIRLTPPDFFRYQYKGDMDPSYAKYELSQIAFRSDMAMLAGNEIFGRNTQPSEYGGIFKHATAVKYHRIVRFKDGIMSTSNIQPIKNDAGFVTTKSPERLYLHDIASKGFATKDNNLDKYLPKTEQSHTGVYWSMVPISKISAPNWITSSQDLPDNEGELFYEVFEGLDTSRAIVNAHDGAPEVKYTGSLTATCRQGGENPEIPIQKSINRNDFYEQNIVAKTSCGTLKRIEIFAEGTPPEAKKLHQNIIEEYNQEELNFWFEWKNMLPEEKHQKMMEIILDSNNLLLKNEKSGSYAYAYAHLGLSGEKNIEWEGADDIKDEITKWQSNSDTKDDDQDDSSTDDNEDTPEEKCGPIEGVPIWEWLPAIQCWLNDLKNVGDTSNKQCSIENPNLDSNISEAIIIPKKIFIYSPYSSLLKERENTINVEFRDNENNITSGENISFTVLLEGAEFANPEDDLRDDIEGFQQFSFSGKNTLSIIPKEENVKVIIQSEFNDQSLVETKIFTSSDNNRLEFKTIATEKKGETTLYTLSINALQNDTSFVDFPDTIYLKTSDSAKSVVSKSAVLHGEEFIFAVRSNTPVELSATIRGFTPAVFTSQKNENLGTTTLTANLQSLPTILNFNSSYSSTIEILDDFGVPIDNELFSQLTFEIKPLEADSKSKAFVRLEKNSTTITSYISTYSTGGKFSGAILLKKDGKIVGEADINFSIAASLESEKFSKFNIPALYASVLGLKDYGDPSSVSDHLAVKLLHNSSILNTITTQIVSPSLKIPSASIGKNGSITTYKENIEPVLSSTTPLQVGIFNTQDRKYLGQFEYIPASQSFTALRSPKTNESGLFVENFDTKNILTLERSNHRIFFSLAGVKVAEVSTSGSIIISDNALSLSLEKNTDTDNLSILLQIQGESLARIQYAGGKLIPLYNANTIKQGFEENQYLIVEEESEYTNLFPRFQNGFSLSAFPTGFEGREKYVLQYAAGNSIGESTTSTAGIFLVNFGDPTIALPPTEENSNGFDETVGKQLMSREAGDIKKVFTLDIDGDGYEDIATILRSGEILFSTNTPQKSMQHWGKGVHINADFLMVGKIDIDGDQYDDILYSDSRGKIFLLRNKKGVWEEDSEYFKEKNSKSGILEDFDNDGYIDLLSITATGEIVISYGKEEGGFDTQKTIDTFTLPLPKEDLSNDIKISFSGITNTKGVDDFIAPLTFASQDPIEKALESAYKKNNIEEGYPKEAEIKESEKTKFFASLEIFKKAFSKKEKKISAVSEGDLELGKRIRFTTTLTSNQKDDLKITLADPYSSLLEVDFATITCTNCGDTFRQASFSESSRAIIFDSIILQPNIPMTISYEAEIAYFPKTSFSASSLNDDSIKDILVHFPDTPEKGTQKYISNGPRSYKISLGNTEIPYTPEDLSDNDNNGVPDQYDADTDGDGIPNFAETIFESQGSDTDNDGIPDSWDSNSQGSFDQISSSLDSIIDTLSSCSKGSCISMPINYAFFVPGQPNLVTPLLASSTGIAAVDDEISAVNNIIQSKVGLPVGFQPTVMTVFNMGPRTWCFGPSCWKLSWHGPRPIPFSEGFSNSIFRFYLSPTLTGGMGAVVCSGPGGSTKSPGGACFIQAVPKILESVCEKIAGDPAKSFQSSLGSGSQLFRVESGYGNTPESSLLSLDLGVVDTTIPVSRNNRSFGGPSFLTKWANRQLEELSAMMSLPHLTVYFPDLSGSFFGTDTEESFTDGFSNKEQWNEDTFEDTWGENNAQTIISASSIQGDTNDLKNSLANTSESSVDALYKKLEPAENFLAEKKYQAESIDDLYRMLESVPLLRIQKKQIIIKIPTLSQKELLALSSDIDTWLKNSKEEFAVFAAQFEGKVGPIKIDAFKELCQSDTWETCRILVNGEKMLVSEFLKQIQDSLEKAEQLKESLSWYLKTLPKLVSQLDGQIAEYIYSLVCYLEAITDLTGGWLVKNKIRYEKWQEFFATVPAILKSFQILPKIFNGYKKSCTTCKAGNYDSGNFIVSLLGNIMPEPPIIKTPRLPDVVLDLSQINAGITLTVPELIFEPTRIDLPQIPPLQLPTLANINRNPRDKQEITIPFIPVLPTIPTLDFPTLEPFPAIAIPVLPDLPPPPLIPDFFADFGNLLEVIDKGLTIYCLIVRKGIFVYPEATAMSVVETLTARPSSNPLSIDFLSKRLPNYNIPSIKEINVTVEVNLEMDIDFLSEPIEDFAEKINNTTTNFFDTGIQTPQFFKQFDQSGAFDDFNSDIQEGVDTIDETINEETQEIAPLFSSTGEKIWANMMEEQMQVFSSKWNKKNPKMVDISVIRKQLGLKKWQYSESKNIKSVYSPLKKELLALQKHHEDQSKKILAGGDISTLTSHSGGIYTAEETITPLVSDATAAKMLLPENLLPSLQNSLPQVINPKEGIFIQDPKGDVFPLMKYQDEYNALHSFFFIDIDADGDKDIIYSTGREIFLKQNNSIKKEKNDVFPGSPETYLFQEILPEFQAPKNLTSSGNNSSISLHVWAESYDLVDGIEYRITNTITNTQRNDATERTAYFLVKKSLLTELEKSYPLNEFFIPQENKISIHGTEWKFASNEKVKISAYDSKSLDINLPYGTAYNVESRWVLPSGKSSTLSPHILLNNSAGSDTNAPFILSDTERRGYIYKANTFTIDNIKDPEGNKITASWDTDNNKSYETIGKTITTKIFREPSQENIPFKIEDQAGNNAYASMRINYIAPQVILSNQEDTTASGFISPRYANTPISMMRERFGVTKKIITSNADETGRYITNSNGDYRVENIDLSPNAIIKDKAGKIIGELFALTGKLKSRDDKYSVIILPGNSKYPMRQVLVNQENTIIANSIIVTPEDNTVQNVSVFPSSQNQYPGVYIKDTNLNDSIVAGPIGLSATENAGGMVIYEYEDQKPLAMIYRYGNIRFFPNTGFSLHTTQNDENQAMRVDIQKNGVSVFEVMLKTEDTPINIDFSIQEGGTIASHTSDQKNKIAALGDNTTDNTALKAQTPQFSDIDINASYYKAFKELSERKILRGYEDGTFRPENKITRAEFVQMAMSITECLDCLNPSEQEKNKFYTPSSFSDIQIGAWYEFCISKAKKIGMIGGYQNGLFEPEENISRAEAIAILLRQGKVALQKNPKKAIGDVDTNAWYYSAMVTAVNIGLIKSDYGFTFPEETITRGEMLEMSVLLLSERDCLVLDSDGDGIYDYVEIYNGFNEYDPSDKDFPGQRQSIQNTGILTSIPTRENSNNNDKNNSGGNNSSQNNNSNNGDTTTNNNDSTTIPPVTYPPNPEGPEEKCPYVPEDYDGVLDNDGCPELDDPPPKTQPSITLFAGDPEICGFLDYKAQIRTGDIIWTAIIKDDNTQIFSKSQSIVVK